LGTYFLVSLNPSFPEETGSSPGTSTLKRILPERAPCQRPGIL
jgi:hypothetical protein